MWSAMATPTRHRAPPGLPGSCLFLILALAVASLRVYREESGRSAVAETMEAFRRTGSFSVGANALAKARPELVAVGLPSTFADPVEDTRMRILALAESLDVDRPQLLAHQSAWYKVALAHRNVPAAYLPENLQAIRAALRAGVRGYLLKDMEPEEVIAAIERAARGELTVAPAMTLKLVELLLEAGFPSVIARRNRFDLWALAFMPEADQEQVRLAAGKAQVRSDQLAEAAALLPPVQPDLWMQLHPVLQVDCDQPHRVYW